MARREVIIGDGCGYSVQAPSWARPDWTPRHWTADASGERCVRCSPRVVVLAERRAR